MSHDKGMDRTEEGKHFLPEDHPEPVAAAVNELESMCLVSHDAQVRWTGFTSCLFDPGSFHDDRPVLAPCYAHRP